MAFIYSFAEDILTRFNILATSYALLYEDSVKREVSMLDVSREMKILHIGCGSLPLTIKYLYKYTPAKLIVGIDNKEKAIKNADLYLNRENIKRRVRIEYGNGAVYRVDDFDIIFLSWGVEPRDKVLGNIFKNAKENCRIILRLPDKSCLEDNLKEEIHRYRLHIVGMVERPMFGSAISLLLVKK